MGPKYFIIDEKDGIQRRAAAKKGTISRRIIAEGSDDNFNYSLHATKGYRRTAK